MNNSTKVINNSKSTNISKNINSSNSKPNSKNDKKAKEKKWFRFQTNYTFLIIALFIYVLRPLNIQKGEESKLLNILSYQLTMDDYTTKINTIIDSICGDFLNGNCENVNKKSSIKIRILAILKKLLFVNSFKELYDKMKGFDSDLVENKDFFNFFKSLIYQFTKNSLSSDEQTQIASFLLQRKNVQNPIEKTLNISGVLNQVNNKINNQINYKKKIDKKKIDKNQLNSYRTILQNVSQKFFDEIISKQKVENQPKTNQPQTNQPQTNQPKTNQPQTNQPQTNQPKTNQPQTNQPKTNEPKTNEPKTNINGSQLKTNEPKTNQPKTNINGSQLKTNEPKTNQPKTNINGSQPKMNQSITGGKKNVKKFWWLKKYI